MNLFLQVHGALKIVWFMVYNLCFTVAQAAWLFLDYWWRKTQDVLLYSKGILGKLTSHAFNDFNIAWYLFLLHWYSA